MINKKKYFEEYVDYIDRMQSQHISFVGTTKKYPYFMLFLLYCFVLVLFFISFKFLNEWSTFIVSSQAQLMTNNFSLERISKTFRFSFDSNLRLRKYEIGLMARFMEVKSVNPKVKQDQIVKKLVCSCFALRRCKQDTNMRSHYRLPSSCWKRRKKTSSDLRNLKGLLKEHKPVKASVAKNDADSASHASFANEPVKKRNKLKGAGSIGLMMKN